MGYQVGQTCYAKKSDAENAYYSTVVPVINANGELIQPQWSELGGWTLNGQTISAALPECNPIENFQDGQMIGWSVFGIYAAVWAVLLIRRRMGI